MDSFSVTKSIKVIHPEKEHSAEETTGRISVRYTSSSSTVQTYSG